MAVLGCVGVVCELDSVFVFMPVFLFLSLLFLLGLAGCAFCVVGFSGYVLFGEFDPGSGRTLAACLTHASRTMKEELAFLD